MSVRTHLALAIAVLALGAPNLAAAEDLAEAQTSYTGAVMLSGDVDVTIGDVYTGANAESTQQDYAFFSGNTLYFGTQDENGNNVDSIIEFYWFESSIDRESDFYVAIVKARSSPNVNDDWYLDVDDSPVIGLNAVSDIRRLPLGLVAPLRELRNRLLRNHHPDQLLRHWSRRRGLRHRVGDH